MLSLYQSPTSQTGWLTIHPKNFDEIAALSDEELQKVNVYLDRTARIIETHINGLLTTIKPSERLPNA